MPARKRKRVLVKKHLDANIQKIQRQKVQKQKRRNRVTKKQVLVMEIKDVVNFQQAVRKKVGKRVKHTNIKMPTVHVKVDAIKTINLLIHLNATAKVVFQRKNYQNLIKELKGEVKHIL